MAVSQQTSEKRPKINQKAISGIFIPFIPILAAMMFILLRWETTYDADSFIILLILISPIFFVVGAIKSAISFKAPGRKILPFIGLTINVVFLALGIYIVLTVRIN